MTKSKSIFVLCLAILIAIFSGCSTKENNSIPELQTNTTVADTDETTTEEKKESETVTENKSSLETTIIKSETISNKSSSSDAITKTAEQKSAGQTTTKKVTTKQKSTSTERQTNTKKVTITQKPTTTKKVTTTAAPYWCDEGGAHHIVDVGPIGWCNSFDEATDKALEYISEHGDSGNFRVKQCYGCGKYTATVTIH